MLELFHLSLKFIYKFLRFLKNFL